MTTTDQAPRWPFTLAIGGITLLFLALRLYRIGEFPFWWDEFASLTWLGEPTLREFLRQSTTLDPATLPAYYVPQYLWYHYLSSSPDSLRYLSLLIALPQAPLLYLLGRDTFGRRAGLVAALALALSPIHVFHAQNIRTYVIFTTFALSSTLAFVRIMRGAPAPWWVLHVVSNIVLYWSHPFATLLLAAQGITLLIMGIPVRRWLPWGLINAGCYLPTAKYMAGVTYWDPELTSKWFHAPALPEFIADLLYDDVISATYQLRVPVEFWSDRAPWMLRINPAMDLLFIAGAVACVAWALWYARRRNRGATVLLALILVLPPLTLYILTLLWRPCIFPRYTVYSSLAAYLFVGATVTALPRAWMRVAGVGAVCVLMGYQALLALPGPQRTPWREAANHVKAHAEPEAPLVLTESIDRDTFAYNYVLGLAPAGRVMASAEQPVDAAELAARCLASGSQSVWAVLAGGWFGDAPPEGFESAAHAHGLLFTRVDFPGIRPIFVYRLHAAISAPAPPPPPHDAPLARVVALGDLAIEWMLHGELDRARAVLEDVQQTHLGQQMAYGRLIEALDGKAPLEGACAAVRASIRAGGHLAEGRRAKAVEVCYEAVAHDPGLLLGWYNLLMALLETSRFEEALPVFDHLLGIELPERAVFALTFDHLITVIRGGGDARAAHQATQLLRSAEEFERAGDVEAARNAIDEAIRRDPDFALAYLHKAHFHMETGQPEQARAAIAKAAALSPGQIAPLAPALAAHLIENDPELARAEAAKLDKEAKELLAALLGSEDGAP